MRNQHTRTHASVRRGRGRQLRAWCAGASIAIGLLAAAGPAQAQLDPLLPIKRVPPTVIIVFDTSFRMLDDGNGNYYDPYTYRVAGDPVAAAAGVTGRWYRRIYRGLRLTSAETSKYETATVVGVSDASAGFSTFWDATRYEIARRGVLGAINERGGTFSETASAGAPRWGVIRLRQKSPQWPTSCDKPVEVQDPAFEDVSDTIACNSAGSDRLGVFAPTVDQSTPNYANTGSTPPSGVVVAVADPSLPAQSATSFVAQVFQKGVDVHTEPYNVSTSRNPYLIPAGRDGADYADRPLRFALVDALARAKAAAGVDGSSGALGCRNTVIVLVTGGQDDGSSTYTSGDLSSVVSGLNPVAGTSRRMPVYVVAVKPLDGDEAELREIASRSGGRYFRTTTATDVQRAVDLAVQAGYTYQADFDGGTAPAASEYTFVSPIVGTVNLSNALDKWGGVLPDTTVKNGSGAVVPQRSNVVITAGFTLGGPDAGSGGGPGFEGRIRAFRSFRPERDADKAIGYKFVKDGRPLWPLLAGDAREGLRGLARTPPAPATRNIYTYDPESRVVVEFSRANAALLAKYLTGTSNVDAGQVEDAGALIDFVRRLPIGAVIGSTPALMDPPSLDPPPDAEYGMPNSENDVTYAGRLRNRRSMLWFGANDGMIHGVDARTGYEVWAFVPFNLLPKLKTLMDGQPVHQFEYFVDSSPKIAEVKMSGEWRSLLLIGQSSGGTFYQAFDVTDAGMGGPAPDSDDYAGVLATFASPGRVRFLWAFPDYASFDWNLGTSGTASAFDVSDATMGGRFQLYGDLKRSATAVEKSVGFTWSDPAVGTLTPNRSINVAIVGSGYFPDLEGQLPNRKLDTPLVRAGHTFYLIDLGTGRVLGDPDSCLARTGCYDVDDTSPPAWKNALQADPTAAGGVDDYVVTKAYLGDLDGQYWRFNFNQTGVITASSLMKAAQPIYNSSALLMLGTSEQYVYFSTGSDSLPRVAAAGGNSGPYKLYGLLDNGMTREPNNCGATWSRLKSCFSHTLEWPNTKKGAETFLVERPSASPSVAGHIVFFTTTLEHISSYCGSSSVRGRLYAFTYQGGAAYDTVGDGDGFDKNDTSTVATVSGRATAPFIVDKHLYFATSGPAGPSLEVFGEEEGFNNGVGQVGVRILSWRELR
jgi:hypothetical protein